MQTDLSNLLFTVLTCCTMEGCHVLCCIGICSTWVCHAFAFGQILHLSCAQSCCHQAHKGVTCALRDSTRFRMPVNVVLHRAVHFIFEPPLHTYWSFSSILSVLMKGPLCPGFSYHCLASVCIKAWRCTPQWRHVAGGRAQGPHQQQPPPQQQQQQQQQQPVQNLVYPPQHVQQQQQMQPARREVTNDYSALFVALIGKSRGVKLNCRAACKHRYCCVQYFCGSAVARCCDWGDSLLVLSITI